MRVVISGTVGAPSGEAIVRDARAGANAGLDLRMLRALEIASRRAASSALTPRVPLSSEVRFGTNSAPWRFRKPSRRQVQPSDLFPFGRPPRSSRRLTSASASGSALWKSRPINQARSSHGLRPSRSGFAIGPATARLPGDRCCGRSSIACARRTEARALASLGRSGTGGVRLPPGYTGRFRGRVLPGRPPTRELGKPARRAIPGAPGSGRPRWRLRACVREIAAGRWCVWSANGQRERNDRRGG